MRKLWHDEAWEEYLYWQSQDKKTLKKINRTKTNNPFRDQPILRLISEKDSSKSERRIYPIFP